MTTENYHISMQKKIKILSIINTLTTGGAEQVLVNTLPELQKLDIDCEVAIFFDKDDLAKDLEKHGIKVHRLRFTYKWNIIAGLFKLHRLLKKNQYDIIHAHLPLAYLYAGLIKPFHSKIKIVTTFHNLIFLYYPPNTLCKKIGLKIGSIIVNKFIDNNTACSQAVAEHCQHFLSLPKIDVIYNGFPLEELYFPNHTTLPILADLFLPYKPKFIAVTPCRVTIQKGHHYLLEAIQLLDKEKLEIGFIFIGNGSEYAKISAAIHYKKLDKWVVQLPAVQQSQLFKIIKMADVVILPSIIEGFPLVIGESMSLGKPVIATEISGVPELIDHGKEGMLVPSKDPVSLAQAIELMVINPKMRDELVKNAKEKIKQFNILTIARQWKIYYEEILHDR